MKIITAQVKRRAVALSRPYTIATKRVEAVDLAFVRLGDQDGRRGLGAASPAPQVTGEDMAACEAAMHKSAEALLGEDPRRLGCLGQSIEGSLRETPAARAALDMALHDLFARRLGIPLVDLLGRHHRSLPTSITIGIKSTDEALSEADEYLKRGFRCLKVKVGLHYEADVERLTKLRERAGPDIAIRVDANQGYDAKQTAEMGLMLSALNIELLEQPVPPASFSELRALPDSLRQKIAADESLLSCSDAFSLLSPPAACGILNIKLMKCGGIGPAMRIANVADGARAELMWGCMDESAISIAAALHAAYASPATRYIDLDGSFDLKEDVAQGGFALRDGFLHLLDKPGLGADMDLW